MALRSSHSIVLTNSWVYSPLFACVLLLLSCCCRANNVAVLVGCNGNGLQFADADARLMATTLVQSVGYRKEDVCVLTSQPQAGEQEATASNISQAIRDMANRQADASQSTFLFFASTHGVETTQGAMMAAKDFNPKQPLGGAQAELTAQKLTQRLSGLKSGLVVAMFDICRKDGLLRAEKDKQNGFVVPQTQAGKVVTLFSSSEGPSFECTDAKKAAVGHGYFTFYVCQGLSRRKSDKDVLPIVGGLDEAAGGVTVKSLHEYVRWNLLEQTNALPGAGGVREEHKTTTGHSSQAEVAGPASSGLGGQLPELECEAIAAQGMLARYEKRTCRAEISPDDKYAVLRNQGLDWYEKRKYEHAADYFQDAFLVKREAFAAFAAGECYDQVGKFQRAEEQYRNALAMDPKYVEAMLNLGVLLYNQGRMKEAEKQWRNIIAIEPKAAVAMYDLGNSFYIQGKFKEAEEQYRNSIAIDPKAAIAMNNLGNLLKAQGREKEAAEQYRNALAAARKYADAMFNLGLLLDNQGREKEAEEQYRNAIAIDPKGAVAMNNLGILLTRQGKFKEAEQQYRNALAAAPKYAYAMNNLGLLLDNQGREKEAEEQYRNAIVADPKYADAMTNLGVLLHNQGREKEATGQFHNALAANPKDDIAMTNLGMLLIKEGKFPQADEQFRNAIKANPKNADALTGLGALLDDKGNLTEAEKWYRDALTIDPKNARAMSGLGALLANQGKLDKAEELFRNALAADPKNVAAMTNLGVLLAKQGKFPQAEEQFRHAIHVAPDDGILHANLAELLFVTKHREEALTEAKTAQRLGVKQHPVFAMLGLTAP